MQQQGRQAIGELPQKCWEPSHRLDIVDHWGSSTAPIAELSSASQQPKHPGENAVHAAGPHSTNPHKDIEKVVNLNRQV